VNSNVLTSSINIINWEKRRNVKAKPCNKLQAKEQAHYKDMVQKRDDCAGFELYSVHFAGLLDVQNMLSTDIVVIYSVIT
jgi:hypothetical protein